MGLTNDSRPVPRACGGKTAHAVMGNRRQMRSLAMNMRPLAMTRTRLLTGSKFRKRIYVRLVPTTLSLSGRALAPPAKVRSQPPACNVAGFANKSFIMDTTVPCAARALAVA